VNAPEKRSRPQTGTLKLGPNKLRKLKPLNQEPAPSIIASQIRDLIMDGTFSPGDQLGEARLADNLNVSRGPVREALQRLAQEGLIRSRRNRGAYVISLSPRDVCEIYGARLAIEQACIVRLCQGDGNGILGRLERLVEQMASVATTGRWATLADLDLKFHTTLVEAAENTRLSKMFATLAVETRMCLNELEPAYPEPPVIVDEHRLMLDAISRGRASEAVQLIEAHLEDAVDQILGTLGAHTV
jgi:DNA-binding GntR family transcriptional regulator